MGTTGAVASLRERVKSETDRKLAEARIEAERARAEAAAARLAEEREREDDAAPASHRAVLAAAFAERAPALAASEKALAALARAAGLVEADEVFARQRADLAQAQAEDFANCLAAGGEIVESPELLAQAQAIDKAQAASEAARDKLAKLQAAHKLLADGSTEADRKLAEVERKIVNAAAAVMNDEATFLVEVLDILNAEVSDINNRLEAFVNFYKDHGVGHGIGLRSPDGLYNAIGRIVRQPFAWMHVDTHKEGWLQYLGALQADPRATYAEAVPPIQ